MPCGMEQAVFWLPTIITAAGEEALELWTVGGEKARGNDKVSDKYSGGQFTSSEKRSDGFDILIRLWG